MKKQTFHELGKIKIFLIIKSLGRGGAEHLLVETLRLINREKFEFEVAYFLPNKNQMVRQINNLDVPVHCFNIASNLEILLNRNYLISYITRKKFDIIHAHLPWAGIAARMVTSRIDSPVIYTEHNIQERYHPVTRLINKLTFNHQKEVFAVSNEVLSSVQKNIKPSVPVSLLLNGVDTEKYKPTNSPTLDLRAKLRIKNGDLIIGTVAVFRKQKRLDIWLKLALRIHNEFPNTFFLILGDGPEEAKIRRIIKKSNLRSIFLPGRLSEVAEWVSLMDIFMITSKHEGLPIALLEAMSMKTPIVTTDAGGIKEIVRNGIEGFIYPVDQWSDMINGLRELIVDGELRIRIGDSARKRICENFSLANMVSQLETHYLRIADDCSNN
jgi:glycosyltransferase involved in cell wall biosynthesis